jgi:hypothetical protein
MLAALMPLLKSHKAKMAFTETPDVDRPVLFWTRPKLRCEVRFLTGDTEKLRFPTFRRMVRND